MPYRGLRDFFAAKSIDQWPSHPTQAGLSWPAFCEPAQQPDNVEYGGPTQAPGCKTDYAASRNGASSTDRRRSQPSIATNSKPRGLQHPAPRPTPSAARPVRPSVALPAAILGAIHRQWGFQPRTFASDHGTGAGHRPWDYG